MLGGQGGRARRWVLKPPYRSDGGQAWIADLPKNLWSETDRYEAPRRSHLRLSENSCELGPGHAVHTSIQDDGEGRYSFWTNVLYFSTSDGTDPNTNSRVYAAVTTSERPSAQAVVRAITPAPLSGDWQAVEKPLRCAVVGLGNRGSALARLIQGFAGVDVAWLCDKSLDRAEGVRHELGGDAKPTTDLSIALADPTVDAVFIALPDHLHRAAAEQAFGAGKHVFIEKPLATTVEDGKAVLGAWTVSGRVLQIGYVLRTAPFYQAIRNVIRQDRLGPVRAVSISDHLGALHGASFMRRWHGESANSGGLIVHKGCHDLDLVCWLLDTRPVRVSSFGGTGTFDRPAPAAFCSQCPERAMCVYADKGLHERRTAAEKEDPTAYGLDRCVFRPESDIVDHQVVAFELASGVHGTFQLTTQTPGRDGRRITVIGDRARLDGELETGSFSIRPIEGGNRPIIWKTTQLDSHGGGDQAIVAGFLSACIGRTSPPIRSTAGALTGLVFATAAETARKTGTVVTIDESDFALI